MKAIEQDESQGRRITKRPPNVFDGTPRKTPGPGVLSNIVPISFCNQQMWCRAHRLLLRGLVDLITSVPGARSQGSAFSKLMYLEMGRRQCQTPLKSEHSEVHKQWVRPGWHFGFYTDQEQRRETKEPQPQATSPRPSPSASSGAEQGSYSCRTQGCL